MRTFTSWHYSIPHSIIARPISTTSAHDISSSQSIASVAGVGGHSGSRIGSGRGGVRNTSINRRTKCRAYDTWKDIKYLRTGTWLCLYLEYLLLFYNNASTNYIENFVVFWYLRILKHTHSSTLVIYLYRREQSQSMYPHILLSCLHPPVRSRPDSCMWPWSGTQTVPWCLESNWSLRLLVLADPNRQDLYMKRTDSS